RRHTRFSRDWSSDVCSSDLLAEWIVLNQQLEKAAPAEVPLLVVLKRYHEHHGKKHTARGGEMSRIALEKAEAFFQPDEPVSALRSEERRVGKERGYAGWRRE